MSVTTTPPTGGGLIPTNIDQAMRLADLMMRGKMIPQHLQGSPGDCLMVIEQAMRWGMSPFAVAQCTSVIQGRLMFEGKLVAAAVQSSGILASRFQYIYDGTGDDRAVTVTATLQGEEQPRTVRIVLKDVRTKNKEGNINRQWTGGQVDQQLSYAGVRAWARRHTPEVMLGVYSPEEFSAEPVVPFAGTTIEAASEPAPAATETAHRRKWSDLLADIHARAALGSTVDEIVAFGLDDADVVKIGQHGGEKVQAACADILTEAMTRIVGAATTAADDFPGDRP